jgi:hypothetical protein
MVGLTKKKKEKKSEKSEKKPKIRLPKYVYHFNNELYLNKIDGGVKIELKPYIKQLIKN